MRSIRTVEYDPFIKSQLAARNQLYGLIWFKFGHVTLEISSQRNPRTPPCGTSRERNRELVMFPCVSHPRLPARREQLERFKGILPERQGQNQALTVLYVPYSLNSVLTLM